MLKEFNILYIVRWIVFNEDVWVSLWWNVIMNNWIIWLNLNPIEQLVELLWVSSEIARLATFYEEKRGILLKAGITR